MEQTIIHQNPHWTGKNYPNNAGECDFVVKKGFDYQAIQVCYELIPENSKREFGGFDIIEKDIKLSKKTIITYNQEQQEKDIEVVPAWKYFSSFF